MDYTAVIGELGARIGKLEIQMQMFTQMRREASKAETTENEESILDSAEVIDENNSAIVELAEMLSNLEERISALEGGNNG